MEPFIMILRAHTMSFYLWLLNYDHNNLFIPLLIFGVRLKVCMSNFSNLREDGNLQVLPQHTIKFSLKTLFMFFVILRRWIGRPTVNTIDFLWKVNLFQILVSELNKSILPRKLTKKPSSVNLKWQKCAT